LVNLAVHLRIWKGVSGGQILFAIFNHMTYGKLHGLSC